VGTAAVTLRALPCDDEGVGVLSIFIIFWILDDAATAAARFGRPLEANEFASGAADLLSLVPELGIESESDGALPGAGTEVLFRHDVPFETLFTLLPAAVRDMSSDIKFCVIFFYFFIFRRKGRKET